MKKNSSMLTGIFIGLLIGAVSYPLIFNGTTIIAAPHNDDSNLTLNQYGGSNTNNEPFIQTQDTTRKINTLIIKHRGNEKSPDGQKAMGGDLKAMNQARGITMSEADELFQGYHSNRDRNRSQGLLRVTDEYDNQKILTHFFLSYDKVVVPLVDKINNDSDNTMVGFSGLLAYDKIDHAHTMLWVAVVKDKNQNYQYYLPSNNQPDDKTYIYDFIDVCPTDCPENYAQLWNEDWKK